MFGGIWPLAVAQLPSGMRRSPENAGEQRLLGRVVANLDLADKRVVVGIGDGRRDRNRPGGQAGQSARLAVEHRNRRGLRRRAGLRHHIGGERGKRRGVGGRIEARAQLRRKPEIHSKADRKQDDGNRECVKREHVSFAVVDQFAKPMGHLYSASLRIYWRRGRRQRAILAGRTLRGAKSISDNLNQTADFSSPRGAPASTPAWIARFWIRRRAKIACARLGSSVKRDEWTLLSTPHPTLSPSASVSKGALAAGRSPTSPSAQASPRRRSIGSRTARRARPRWC